MTQGVNFNGPALAAAFLASTAVPTMGEWALIGMSWLLGLFGLRQLSRTIRPRRDLPAA